MNPHPLPALRAFARDARGGASIELAIGAVALLAVSALCFDLYSRVRAYSASGRIVATMADYVARDASPDGDELKALGALLPEHEIDVPVHVAYVISALRQPAGDPPPAVEVLWSDDSIRAGGDATVGAELAQGCARHVAEGGKAALPDAFASEMGAGEVLIVAELCARLTREGSLTGRFVAGDLYRFHALPARDPEQAPAAPSYTAPEDPGESASLDRRRSGMAASLLVAPARARPAAST